MTGRNVITRPRDERGHPVVKDAIERGFVHTGDVYTDIGDLPSHDIANTSRRLIKNAGQHLGVSVAAWVADADGQPCYRNCADPSAPHKVLFRVFTKNSGRAKVVEDTGGDPAKLRYNPFKRAAPRILDDDGHPVS